MDVVDPGIAVDEKEVLYISSANAFGVSMVYPLVYSKWGAKMHAEAIADAKHQITLLTRTDQYLSARAIMASAGLMHRLRACAFRVVPCVASTPHATFANR